MIQIAIVEDQNEFSDQLVEYIQRFSTETRQGIEVTRFTNGLNFIEDYSGKFQIVFMDIAMPHMDGMEAARRLREIDREVTLIFFTSLVQYAVNGYEVQAMDFLVKPISYELFRIKLDRAIAHLRIQEFYTVRVANGMKKIALNDLVYVESKKHYLYFHTRTEEVRMRGTMPSILVDFEDKGFAQASGSLLINLAFVDEMHGKAVRIQGEEIVVARAYRTSFWNHLAAYLGGGRG